jgi:hypothetical protein
MARTPGTQSSSELTRAGAGGGGRHRGIGIGRNIQRTAAGKFNRAERAGNAAQLAAYAQAFVELDRAIDAIDGVNRTDGGAGASSQWWHICGADSFSLRMTCSRGMACRPCWRCVSEQAASQVRQPIQTVESAITKRFTGSSSGESHF